MSTQFDFVKIFIPCCLLLNPNSKKVIFGGRGVGCDRFPGSPGSVGGDLGGDFHGSALGDAACVLRSSRLLAIVR